MKDIKSFNGYEIHDYGHGFTADQIVNLGGWQVNTSNTKVALSTDVSRQGSKIVSRWKGAFTREDTWVQNEHNVPSLIVRFDATVDPKGNLKVYEIEERPAGIGMSSRLNPEFRDRLSALRATWPNTTAVISGRRTGSDDQLWINVGDIDNPPGDGKLLIRAEPEETQYSPLAERSISTFRTKGDKSYGERMKLWSRIRDPQSLPWDQAFVLKPLQGSKTRDVRIWNPENKDASGVSTKSKVLNTLAGNGAMYLQDFIPPISSCNGEGKNVNVILRVYYGFDAKTNHYIPMGGLWNARRNLVVHGASDSVFGPVILM